MPASTWYLRGNDLKFQLGAMYGKTKETVTGAPAEANAARRPLANAAAILIP